jgi:hypothetical protein
MIYWTVLAIPTADSSPTITFGSANTNTVGVPGLFCTQNDDGDPDRDGGVLTSTDLVRHDPCPDRTAGVEAIELFPVLRVERNRDAQIVAHFLRHSAQSGSTRSRSRTSSGI